MKIRKLFALLMAAVMLLGMMPMAQAEVVNCDHNWVWRWPNGQPVNCQDWKWSEKYCTKCGVGDGGFEQCGPCVPGSKTWVRPQGSNCQEFGVWEITCKYCGEWLEGREEPGPHKWSETIVEEPWCDVGGMKAMICSVCGEWQNNGTPLNPLGHNWGSWRWAHGYAPSCTEGAWQVRECKRCGRQEDRWVGAGSHKFGEWITTVEPTCTERGRHHHICSVCGYSEWAPIDTIDHVYGEWHVIEEPQVGIPGTERRSCTFGCGTHEDREIPPLEETLSAEGLELTLVLTSVPANGTHFVVGEEVTFTETWVNNSDKTLYPFSVSIFTCAAPEYGSEVDQIGSWFAEDAGGPVAPGATGSHTLTVTVTEADVARGSIYAMAELLSTVQDGPDLENVTTPFVTAPCASVAVVNSAGVRLEKELRNAPANGEYYVPGEVLNYALTLRIDDGLLLDDAAIYDPINGGDGLVISYGEGLYGSMGMDVFYVVTEEDAQRGYVENTAYATWIYRDSGEAGRCESETVIAVCGMGDLPEDYEAPGLLEITTVATTTPANGSYYTEGETVILADVFTNRSANLTLTGSDWVNVEILGKGIFNRNDNFGADAVLAPGESKILLYSTYVITAEDVAQGYIQKTVHAGFVGDDGIFYTGSFEIRIPCAPEAEAGLTVTKSASAGDYSDPCKPGDEVIFTITVTNNTGVELLDVEITDPIKGGNEDSIVDIIPSMQPGESVTASFSYTVTEEDATVGVEGFENTAYASGHTAEGTQVSGTSNTIFVWCVVEHGLTFFKSIANVPANGEFFVPGETIVFEISMIDNTPYPLYNITLTDPLCEDQYTYDAVNDMSYLYFGELYPEGNAMGESTSATVTVSYVVTEADAEAGSVTNTAEATYQTWYGETRSDSASVTAKCGKAEDNDMGLSGALSVTKSVTSTPANGSFYVPGETVTFNVQVVNTGAPMDSLSVSDWMWERSCSFGTINTNEDVTYPVSYTVTELDAINGSVSNIACAEAVATDGDSVMEYSNIVTVPCGFPEGDDPFGVLTGLDISKEVESLPLNGSYYTEGETVAYKIIYTNSGELPLTDVQIYDAMGGMGEIATAEMLNPGESRVCWFNHTVTAADVSRGYISNTAVGQYELSGWVNTASSNTVTVDTNGKQDLWTVHPFWPGEDPEYDPGTGWLPDSDPDLEGDTPSFGAIDTDALHSGETYCVRTITGRDNVSVSYETGFCAVHSLVQSSALLMQQAAATPEMQVQAAAYATALWRNEVEKLYQELMAAADPAAQAVLMTEYIRFVTDVANYEAMLKVLHPDQPALAASKVAEIWENKCIDLCYDTHAAADERKDSLLAVTPTAGTAAVSCTCEVTAQEAGRKAIVQRYCAMHGFPFSMTDVLLRGNDTADAWTMVRQIWGVELTSAYNKLYAAMGENKPLAMAEQHALTQWMMAREASLIALYPDNPEVVAQLMAKLIMERVNDLCQVTK